jgi:hypothetical protein
VGNRAKRDPPSSRTPHIVTGYEPEGHAVRRAKKAINRKGTPSGVPKKAAAKRLPLCPEQRRRAGAKSEGRSELIYPFASPPKPNKTRNLHRRSSKNPPNSNVKAQTLKNPPRNINKPPKMNDLQPKK